MGNLRTAEQERACYWRRHHWGQCVWCGEPADHGRSMRVHHLALDFRNKVKRRTLVR